MMKCVKILAVYARFCTQAYGDLLVCGTLKGKFPPNNMWIGWAEAILEPNSKILSKFG